MPGHRKRPHRRTGGPRSAGTAALKLSEKSGGNGRSLAEAGSNVRPREPQKTTFAKLHSARLHDQPGDLMALEAQPHLSDAGRGCLRNGLRLSNLLPYSLLDTVNQGCFPLAPPQAPAWSHPIRLPLSSRLNSGNSTGGGQEADGRGPRAGPAQFFQARRPRLAEPRCGASLTSQNNSYIGTKSVSETKGADGFERYSRYFIKV